MSESLIQSKFTSILNPYKIVSCDEETDREPTMRLIHSAARLLYITEGEGTIQINEKQYRLVPHTMVSLQPWDISEIVDVKKPLTYKRIIYNLNFINLFVRSDFNPHQIFMNLWQNLHEVPVAQIDPAQYEVLEGIMERLHREVGSDAYSSEAANQEAKPFSEVYIVSLIIEILVLFERSKHDEAPETEALDQTEDFEVRNMLNYLYSHMQEKITLDRLNQVFFVSPSTITKKLKRTLGYTFQELITAMRIYKAMDLLAYTDLKLQDIAHLVGFNDAAHLVRTFSQQAYMTPNAYRQTMRRPEKLDQLKTRESAATLAIINDFLAQYDNPQFTPKTIANKYQISIAELNRITMYYVERSASEFIAWLRVNRAAEMLLCTDLPVTEIALIVGFNTLKTFYRYFHKYYDLSPTEFREEVHYQHADGTVEGQC
ncbi:MAG: helix-turn-helix domain-containing protein [Peptoniphilaceae bacterium]|nr:helix-turn-helix domain-containing protein [Peptoniphilaceae bacterium]MDY6085524.1 helix-turn-helix domain-containing protein [Peptoniphilaceae bacterium]